MGYGVRVSKVLESVGANVRRWRLRRGFTQDKLAEKIVSDLRFLQRVESGRYNLSVGLLARLGFALDVKPSVLLRPAKPVERPTGRPRQKKRRSR